MSLPNPFSTKTSRLIIRAKNRLVCTIHQQVGYCSVRCQKLHWQTHKKFCKQLAKEYEEMLAAKLAEEKLEEEMRSKGENKTVVNGNAEEHLNTENSETKKDQKTDTPTDNLASGVPEEKDRHL